MLTAKKQNTASPSERPPPSIERAGPCFVYRFAAMASPCEVRLETDDESLARAVSEAIHAEAIRIETKYSRYRPDSVVARINASFGAPVRIDDETARIIEYCAQCWEVSDGLFDITSGVLRKLWRFDGSRGIPSINEINAILPFVGWEKASWSGNELTLPTGMEIDFGGVGKEYAVDRAVDIVRAFTHLPALINFGGDLRVTSAKLDHSPWRVSVESVESANRSEGLIAVSDGALTTSGDARRHILHDRVRYSHILNPKTGWPVANPPRSVTIAAPTCSAAGFLSTLAMLHGEEAEEFLSNEGVRSWVLR